MAQALPEPSDDLVETFVANHPGGANEGEIAAVLGMSHQRVHAIVANAIRKLRRRFSNCSADDFIIERPAGSPAARMMEHGRPR